MSRIGNTITAIGTAVVVVGGGFFFLASLGFLSPIFLFGSSFSHSVKQPEQIRYAYDFTATGKHYLFGHNLMKEQVIVVFDAESHDLTVYRASKGRVGLRSPSRANDTAYFVYSEEGFTVAAAKAGKKLHSVLHKCELAISRCAPVFDLQGYIGPAVDFSDGNLIFVGTEPELSKCGMFVPSDCVRYRNLDFYVRRSNAAIERLTNWRHPELLSVSAAEHRLVFQFYSRLSSQVYSAELAEEGPTIGHPEQFLSYGKNGDVLPHISPDGSKTAFLSSSESVEGSFRYDILIAENASQRVLYKIIPDPHSRLSPPIFIDANRIRYMSFDGERYKFWVFDVSTGKEDLIGEVTTDDIRRAKVYDFAKEQL